MTVEGTKGRGTLWVLVAGIAVLGAALAIPGGRGLAQRFLGSVRVNTVQAAPAARPMGPSGYHLIKTIPVPGAGGWDYLHFDAASRRLYIAHSDQVVVVDPFRGKIVGTIGGMDHIHGVVVAPEFHRGFVTDGGAAKVLIFDPETLKVTGSAPAAPDADGEVYDPASKRVFTFNGDSHSSTVVDAATGKTLKTIPLGADPEFPVADGKGHVYDNLESTSQIVEIDSHSMMIMHRWPVAPAEHPSGLAMDTEHGILFSGCRNKLMAMVNADTGKVIQTLPIGQGVDATRFDPGTGYAFASNGGSGTLTVIHEDSPTKFHIVENVTTEPGARTMALDPMTHEVFLATAKLTRIAHPKPHTRPFRIVPGTFHILVYAK
jgi:DNA-binding beta-propeller fold protein YncE